MSAHPVFDVSGRIVIVTGGTRGLGRAVATGFAEAGAVVWVTGRDHDRAVEAASEIVSETGGEVSGFGCHVGDWDAPPRLVDAVVDAHGRIDVLVNNAGINPMPMPVMDMTCEYWDKLFAVNVRGPLRVAQLVAPVMAEGGGGAIVNVATTGAYTGGPGIAAYSASKAALVNLTKVMAREWAPLDVRVNAVSPGPFRTDMVTGAEAVAPGFMDSAASATFQHRVADPHELVGAVVYLASDAASFVTGEDHLVSGGMLRS